MAAKTEGIALLSMYNDEEEEEEGEQEERREGGRGRGEEEKEDRDDGDLKAAAGVAVDSESAPRRTPTAMDSRTPPLAEEGLDSKTLASPAPLTPTPPRPPPQHRVPPPPASSLSSLSLYSLSDALDAQPQGSGKRSLTIVDYAHDETAMSPEAEEYEKVRVGRLMFGEELHASAGIIEERTPQRIFQTSTPSSQCTPSQPFEQLEESKSGTNMAIDMMRMEIETHLEMDVSVSVEMQQEVDPLKNFLPPPLTIRCPEELQKGLPDLWDFQDRFS